VGGPVAIEVPPAPVVDVAVGVVVDAVRLAPRAGLAVVGPQVVLDVRVADLDAGVQHRHDDVAAARGHVPRLGHVHAAQVPLVREHRVVRDGVRRTR
jgi:hypothetical protein